MFRHVRLGSCVVVAALWLIGVSQTSVASSGEQPREPLAVITAAGAVTPWQPQRNWISRSRPVEIDVDALLLAAHDPAVGALLELPLFGDVSYVADVVETNAIAPRRAMWRGDLVGVEGGWVILTVYEDTVYGVLGNPHGRMHEILPVGDGRHVVQEIIAELLPGCGTGPEHGIALPAMERPEAFLKARSRHRVDAEPIGAPPELRVLVAYTPAAQSAAGGFNGMMAMVDNAMAQTNTSFVNSEIDMVATLAGTHEVSYTGSGNISTDLSRLRAQDNGHMDEIHQLRIDMQADLVALLVTYQSGSCGVAYCMGTPSVGFYVNAFSVTRIQCIPNLTFPHELAHNMGSHHDHDNAGGSCGTYAYSFGHRFWAGGTQYRTVMAYQPGQRIPHFSNPDVFVNGTPSGVPINEPNPAHNALSINNNADIVTSFADQLPPPECLTVNETWHVPGDFATIQTALNAANHCDEIVVAPGVYNETINFNGRSIWLRSAAGPEQTIIDGTGFDDAVVVFNTHEKPDATLDGFTIRGGSGRLVQIANNTYHVGGGIYVHLCEPTIVNCIIEDNTAEFGGGIFVHTAEPHIASTTFIGNHSTSAGGGLFNFSQSQPVIENCTFVANTAGTAGGGMSNQSSHPAIVNCTFEDNTAATDGGGVRFIQSSQGSITGSSFRRNEAAGTGGGIVLTESNATAIGGSTFCENSPNAIAGSYTNSGGNSFLDTCPVVGDLNGDGVVDVSDLLILLGEWGECADPDDCPADLNNDGVVDVSDLLLLLGNWG